METRQSTIPNITLQNINTIKLAKDIRSLNGLRYMNGGKVPDDTPVKILKTPRTKLVYSLINQDQTETPLWNWDQEMYDEDWQYVEHQTNVYKEGEQYFIQVRRKQDLPGRKTQVWKEFTLIAKLKREKSDIELTIEQIKTEIQADLLVDVTQTQRNTVEDFKNPSTTQAANNKVSSFKHAGKIKTLGGIRKMTDGERIPDNTLVRVEVVRQKYYKFYYYLTDHDGKEINLWNWIEPLFDHDGNGVDLDEKVAKIGGSYFIQRDGSPPQGIQVWTRAGLERMGIFPQVENSLQILHTTPIEVNKKRARTPSPTREPCKVLDYLPPSRSLSDELQELEPSRSSEIPPLDEDPGDPFFLLETTHQAPPLVKGLLPEKGMFGPNPNFDSYPDRNDTNDDSWQNFLNLD